MRDPRAGDRPGDDRPREDRPGDDRPGDDRPGEDRPGEDRPRDESPTEEPAEDAGPRPGLPRRPPLQMVAMLAIGAVVGVVGTLTWTVAPSSRVVEGVLGAIDPTGSAILLAEPADVADTGYGVVGVLWREGDGAWQRTLSDDGFPTCLEPGDEGRPVLLGLVTDPGGVGRPASEVVAWVQCPPR